MHQLLYHFAKFYLHRHQPWDIIELLFSYFTPPTRVLYHNFLQFNFHCRIYHSFLTILLQVEIEDAKKDKVGRHRRVKSHENLTKNKFIGPMSKIEENLGFYISGLYHFNLFLFEHFLTQYFTPPISPIFEDL